MDIYPVPLPAGYSSVSSSFYIAVFGVAFLYSDSLWSFFIVEFPVGGVVSVACQGFLVREACVHVLVGGAGFLLSEVQ